MTSSRFSPVPMQTRIHRAANAAGMANAQWARWKAGEDGYAAYKGLQKAVVLSDQRVDELCVLFGWHPTEMYEDW